MSQCCGKVPSPDDAKDIRRSIEGHQSKYQGELGEQAVSEFVTNELDLNAEFFDQKSHGFDGVFRNGLGKLVLVESKLTQASGLSSLGQTRHGREGSVEWVEHVATLMTDPTSTLWSPDNAKIGEEILSVGPENVDFLVVHINPETLVTDVTKLR